MEQQSAGNLAGLGSPGEPGGEGVVVGTHKAMGLVSLDRPAALNALDRRMRERISAAYRIWTRDIGNYCVVVESAHEGVFCAGGDLRELARLAREAPAEARACAAQESLECWTLDRFGKPNVALIDGYHAGSGVGISLHGTHRVAGEAYRLAMPEVAAGYFPDAGGGWFLARLPHEIGMYLALTGRPLGRADAYRLRLATHCIGRRHFAAIKAALAEAEPVDQVLDALHETPEPGPDSLLPLADAIEACFSATSVGEILARLDGLAGPHGPWAGEVAADIRRHSPMALAVAFALLRRGRRLGLKEVLELDYRVASRRLPAPDLQEGVRALLIDKDRRPRWQPASLAEVDPGAVEAHFAPLPAGEEMVLPQIGVPPSIAG